MPACIWHAYGLKSAIDMIKSKLKSIYIAKDMHKIFGPLLLVPEKQKIACVFI